MRAIVSFVIQQVFFKVADILSGDIVARYYLELQIGENSVIVLNKNGTEFFIRDFNSQRKILWVSNSHTLYSVG